MQGDRNYLAPIDVVLHVDGEGDKRVLDIGTGDSFASSNSPYSHPSIAAD